MLDNLKDRIAAVCIASFIIGIIILGLVLPVYMLICAVTNNLVVKDEVYQTVDGGRKIRHCHYVDPIFGITWNQDSTSIVEE